MNKALEIAQQYFDYSNKQNLDGIALLLGEHATYSSVNTGIHIGKQNILQMTKDFFNSFQSLHWDVQDIIEIKPGVVRFDFTLTGVKNDGKHILKNGFEYVVIAAEKIQHIEVRNK
jgi:hypothetical protein